MTHIIRTLVVAFLLIPSSGHAQILISEIAWMGTDTDANNEWIEIYNFSNAPQNLAGWTVEGSVSINLVGVLPPHGVALLERTDDNSVPGVTALLTYTGALPNEAGGTITIKDAGGAVSDQATGGTNWSGVGGSNTVPKKTAQRTRTGTWVTAAPTPGIENAQVSDPVSTTTQTVTEITTTQSSGGGGGGPAKRHTAEPKILKDTPSVLSLAVNGPTTVYVNQEASFQVIPTGIGSSLSRSLTYDWNLGDLTMDTGKEVKHTFKHPGEYVIAVEGVYAKHRAIVRHEVTVRSVLIRIERGEDGTIVLKNTANYEADVSGFNLKGQGSTLTLPKLTFIKAQGSLTIPKTRFQSISDVALYDTQGESIVTLRAKAVSPGATSLPKAQEVTLIPEPRAFAGEETKEVIRIGEPKVVEEPLLKRLFGKLFGF